MFAQRLLSFACLSLLLALCAAQDRVRIGELSTEEHDVSGTVYALNSRTLEIDNFIYDGLGPAAVFWVDIAEQPTREGILAPDADTCELIQKLPPFSGETVRVELPNDLTLSDIGYFSIWCEAVGVSFGGTRIDAGALPSAPTDAEPQCGSGGEQPAQRILVGDLSTEQHGVSGTVYALNSRTLEIDNFSYDGMGPAAVFWVDIAEQPTREGIRAPDADTCELIEELPAFSGDTVRVELPNGLTLSDIGYFSIWCEAVGVSFGGIRIDVDALPETPSSANPACGAQSAFPVRQGYSCKSLSSNYQVRWQLDSENEAVNIELVAVLGENMYMGFGVSGSDQGTDMVGSDVAIAFKQNETYSAIDYHMSARSSCSGGEGVCPDVDRNGNGADHITNVEGASEGRVLRISYTRPIAAIDSDLDRPIRTDGPTFISWATGPLETATQLPRFHGSMRSITFPGEDVQIDFNLEAEDSCTAFENETVEEEEPRAEPFERPVFSDITNFTARIGPSGGARGVTALKGISWGIAWYMSPEGSEGGDVLIPAIGVERGKTYRFKVNGGNTGRSSFHPLYITSNPKGGYENVAPEDRLTESVYAGINVTARNESGIFEYVPTALGALCEFKTDIEDTADIETYEEFYQSLDTSCTQDENITRNAGELIWTVQPNTPDVVYYQCVTHEFLGFEIRVFDEGEVDVSVLRQASAGINDTETMSCTVTVNNEELTYEACTEIDASSEYNVFWNINGDEIETLIRARTAGYAGFGWGYDSMVPGNAVIVYRDGDNSADIDDYQLSQRRTSGVQPSTNQELTDVAAFVDGDFVIGQFTRKLSVADLPVISASGETTAIWSIGPRSNSNTTLEQHIARGTATINLSQGSSTASNAGPSAFFIVHGAFMGMSWLVFVPTAIIVMRYFKKYNPISFQIHRALNGTSVTLVIVAYFMGIARGNRVERAHLIIGSILFCFTVIQGLGGLLRPHRDAPARKPWYFAHALSGSAAWGLGIANVFLGIAAITNRDDGARAWYAVAGVAVAVAVLIHVCLSAFPTQFPVRYDENAEDNEGTGNGVPDEETAGAEDSRL